jgi:menaquinone-dependent protoporphyrinogen IX oxidase
MDVAEEFIGLTLPTTPVLSSSNTNTRPGTVLASVSSSPTRVSPTDPASSRNKLSGLKISSPASADLKDKMAKTNATLYNSNDNKFFLSDIKLGTPNTDPMVDKNAFSTKFKTTSQSLSNGIDAAVNLWLPTSSEMIIINKAKSLLTENQDRVVALGKIGVYVHLKVNNALTRPAAMPEIEDFPKMSDIKVVCDDVVMPFLKELNDFNNFLKKIDTDLRTLPSELYKSAFSAATFTTLLTGYTNYVSTEVPNLVKLADNCKSFTTEMDSAMSRYMSFVNNDIKRLSDDIKKTQDFMTARVNLFNRRFKGLAAAMIQATKDVASITEHNDFHTKFVKNLFTQFNPSPIALPAVSTFTATMNWKVQTVNINPDNTIRLYTEDVFAAPATPSTETVYYLPVDISASRTTTTTATTTPPATPILHVCTFIPPSTHLRWNCLRYYSC